MPATTFPFLRLATELQQKVLDEYFQGDTCFTTGRKDGIIRYRNHKLVPFLVSKAFRQLAIIALANGGRKIIDCLSRATYLESSWREICQVKPGPIKSATHIVHLVEINQPIDLKIMKECFPALKYLHIGKVMYERQELILTHLLDEGVHHIDVINRVVDDKFAKLVIRSGRFITKSADLDDYDVEVVVSLSLAIFGDLYGSCGCNCTAVIGTIRLTRTGVFVQHLGVDNCCEMLGDCDGGHPVADHGKDSDLWKRLDWDY